VSQSVGVTVGVSAPITTIVFTPFVRVGVIVGVNVIVAVHVIVKDKAIIVWEASGVGMETAGDCFTHPNAAKTE
jgi:hypothetical protein